MIEDKTEGPYPDTLLIAGGPCTQDNATWWRAALCLLCGHKWMDRPQNVTDTEWLDRFRAECDLHHETNCGKDLSIVQ